MKLVVVGGHTRNIGKTSVMSALIREFAPLDWTAIKITQYGHGVCSQDGHACDCQPKEHPFALTEEKDPDGRGDTSRYLAAGARRSLWLRAREGQLGSAFPLLKRKLTAAEWVVIESNSILEFVDPLLYLVVLDRSRADFKASAARWLARADAMVSLPGRRPPSSGGRLPKGDSWPWAGLGADLFRVKPWFPVHEPDFWSAALAGFIRRKLVPASTPGAMLM